MWQPAPDYNSLRPVWQQDTYFNIAPGRKWIDQGDPMCRHLKALHRFRWNFRKHATAAQCLWQIAFTIMKSHQWISSYLLYSTRPTPRSTILLSRVVTSHSNCWFGSWSPRHSVLGLLKQHRPQLMVEVVCPFSCIVTPKIAGLATLLPFSGVLIFSEFKSIFLCWQAMSLIKECDGTIREATNLFLPSHEFPEIELPLKATPDFACFGFLDKQNLNTADELPNQKWRYELREYSWA